MLLFYYFKKSSLCAQTYLTLCDPMDCSPPGSSVHGDSPGKNTGVGCHALLQGNLPDTGIEPTSLMSPVLTGGFFTTRGTWEAPWFFTALKIVPCEVWCGESRNLENCVFEYVSLSSWQFLLSFFLTS